MADTGSMTVTPSTWTPWRSVVAFGVVSLAADMVYEGMRSAAGPFLGSLGASAVTVGLVTGGGEAVALALRLVTGPVADRTGRHWGLTTLGYGLTAVCVPLLAIAPFLGGAGVAVASLLILAERTGKAIRSPSKSALLAGMAASVGRGRGFAVHKALDQVGAFAGPLVVAGCAALSGELWLGFLVLAIPGAVSLVLLADLRRHAPIEEPRPRPRRPRHERVRLPRSFRLFAFSCSASTLGLMTFGVVSYAFVDAGLVSLAVVPVVYAGAMAVEAVAALGTGLAYDRIGPRVLYPLPLLVAAVPALVFAPALGAVLAGVVLWGLATGVQDSTVKALVADLVPDESLATAYGVFAAAQGGAALVGGVLAGALYADHLGLLVTVVAVLQAVALATLVPAVRHRG
ncbi:MFS transporter [Nocardioides aquiterrae]|uniref:MFS transporter n=2 Tax=Nocardioides aquiterrae TaxID=203799 RepID=A0ABN1UAI4_9ACTN